jgi:hypothetical protein
MSVRPVEWSREVSLGRAECGRTTPARAAAATGDGKGTTAAVDAVSVGAAASEGPAPLSIVAAEITPTVPTFAVEEPAPELPPLDVARVRAIVKGQVPAREAGRVETLRQEALVLAAKGFAGAALMRAMELAKLDPDAADHLRFEPAMVNLAPQLDEALRRLIPAARSDAEERLERAARIASAAELRRGGQTLAETRAVLRAARRCFGRGTQGGYRRASQLAQVVIDYYGAAAVQGQTQRGSRPRTKARATAASVMCRIAGARRLARVREKTVAQVRGAWSRLPLLMLLLGWLAAGLAGGVAYRLTLHDLPGLAGAWWVEAGFEIWGLGFPALVGYGFYARVRHIRFTIE